MPGSSARAANTWLITCTRQLTSQSASDAVSWPLRDNPALEKKMSIGPYLSSAAAISAWMSASSPTSAVTAKPSMSPATLANRSRELFRSATTTPRAPASAYARATASPIPLAPPVTTQTLSLMFMVTASLVLYFNLVAIGHHNGSALPLPLWERVEVRGTAGTAHVAYPS